MLHHTKYGTVLHSLVQWRPGVGISKDQVCFIVVCLSGRCKTTDSSQQARKLVVIINWGGGEIKINSNKICNICVIFLTVAFIFIVSCNTTFRLLYPQVSLVYLGIEMIQPGKPFLKFNLLIKQCVKKKIK